MKRLTSLALDLCLFCIAVLAQQPTPSNFGAAGISYLAGGSVAGTGLYAHQLSAGMYAFTVVDAVPSVGLKPFTVNTQPAVGIAQRVFSIAGVPVFVPTAAGVSFNGSNTGWAWSTGALGIVPLKADSPWKILPSARLVKSSISGSGYQVIVGIAIGWGW